MVVKHARRPFLRISIVHTLTHLYTHLGRSASAQPGSTGCGKFATVCWICRDYELCLAFSSQSLDFIILIVKQSFFSLLIIGWND